MNFDQLFVRSAKIAWRKKSLWVFGWLAALGGLASGVIIQILTRSNLDFSVADTLFARAESLLIQITPGYVALFLAAPLLFGSLFWLTTTLADGALIWAGSELETGKDAPFKQAWSAGIRFLGRLVAIDTLLFLPIFLLFLAVLLIASGGLIGTAFVATRPGATGEELLTTLGIAGAATTPFLCLLLPVGLATYFLRILAFRGAAATGLDARQSIRYAWRLLRTKTVHVLLLGLLLWGARYLIRLPLGILTIVVTSAGLMPLLLPSLSQQMFGQGSDFAVTLLAFALSLTTALINGIVGVFVSMTWTLAYLEWVEPRVTEAAG